LRAAAERLRERGVPVEAQVETMLPEPDSTGFVRFHLGNVLVLRNRSRQARRFAMGNAGDVVLTVEGAVGVTQMLDLALGLEKPVLALPFSGGASLGRWKENRELVRSWFELDDAEVARLESARPGEMAAEELLELARLVKRVLLRRLRPKCFVIMP